MQKRCCAESHSLQIGGKGTGDGTTQGDNAPWCRMEYHQVATDVSHGEPYAGRIGAAEKHMHVGSGRLWPLRVICK